MNSEELRAIMDYLRDRVYLTSQDADDTVVVDFHTPTETEMVEAGLNPAGVKRILGMPWWDEMVTDIIDTPDMCDPDDLPKEVLLYARDVVSEYIRKRFPLDGD
jgi:YVTN family beta-propeller protein